MIISKICSIFNYAPHYRKNIFSLMGRTFDTDFYFGDKLKTKIKKIDYSILSNQVVEVKNILLFGPIYYQKGVLKLICKNYDKYIVTGEFYCISTWLLMLLSKFTNKKIYLWSHGWYGHEPFLKRLFKKVYYGLCDGVFLYGDYSKELMIKNGIKENKLHVLYNSLDYDNQIEQRKAAKRTSVYQNHFGNKNKVLIFIGRLNQSKRLDMLIEALSLLKQRDQEYNLVLIGTGDDNKNLQKNAKSRNIKNIWFYGACYDEKELSNLIFNADLCVSPGNIGLTAIHSLMYGTPVLTHNNFTRQGPEFEAITEGQTGLFFDYNNVVSLAKRIEEWFQLVSDQEKDRIAKKCFKIIDQKYNPHYQIKVLNKILSNI